MIFVGSTVTFRIPVGVSLTDRANSPIPRTRDSLTLTKETRPLTSTHPSPLTYPWYNASRLLRGSDRKKPGIRFPLQPSPSTANLHHRNSRVMCTLEHDCPASTYPCSCAESRRRKNSGNFSFRIAKMTRPFPLFRCRYPSARYRPASHSMCSFHSSLSNSSGRTLPSRWCFCSAEASTHSGDPLLVRAKKGCSPVHSIRVP